MLNINPTKVLNFLNPIHILIHKVPSYTHLRVFGCLCYPNFSATSPYKLSPRSTPCIFLGYTSSHKGYRCLDIKTNKVIISRHLTFDENIFPYASQHTPRLEDYVFESPTCKSINQPSPISNSSIRSTSNYQSPQKDTSQPSLIIPDPMSTHPVVIQSPVQHSPVIPQLQYNDELISSTPQNLTIPIVSNPDQFVNPASTPHPIHLMRTRAKCGIHKPDTCILSFHQCHLLSLRSLNLNDVHF